MTAAISDMAGEAITHDYAQNSRLGVIAEQLRHADVCMTGRPLCASRSVSRCGRSGVFPDPLKLTMKAKRVTDSIHR